MSKQREERAIRPQRSRKSLALAAAATIGLLTAGACSSPPESGSPTTQRPAATPNLQLASALLTFDSCDAVLQNIKTEANQRITAYGLQTPDGRTRSGGTVETTTAAPPSQRPVPTTTAPASPSASGSADAGAAKADSTANEAPAPAGAGAGQGGAASTPAHSGTNVQEAGVDEPDLVKNDGKRMFVLLDGTLRSFTIVDGNPKPAGELSLRGSSGNGEQQLLMSGDKLLVLTKGVTTTVNSGGRRAPSGGDDVVDDGGTSPLVGTQLIEIDASDPANMKQTSQIVIDGNVVDARLVGGTARVVLESSPAALSFVRPTSSSKKALDAAKAANQRIIDDSTTSDWLPQYSVAGSNERRPLVECAGVSHPQQFGGFGMVTVLTVEIGKGINPRNSVAVQADADKVYATKDRLFVSTNRAADASTGSTTTGATASAGGGSRSDAPVTTGTRPGIDCDPACPPPERPTTTRATPKTPEIKTSIHEFDITGTGPAVYRASGEVRGHLFNDFAMSSRDGFLRVATTDTSTRSSRGTGGTESYVSVLHEESGELKVVGQVGGMGKGEQIKSVRFIDSVGYVVTFRQTDPLYTIDLANPRDPKIAGELEILGYSAYLHPIAPGRLLGVGQDATAQGRSLGTQVSLFDVSNPAQPSELQKISLPTAHSDAEQDYHAFLWWDPTKLAMIPVQTSGRTTTTPVPCPPDATCSAAGDGSSQPFVGAIGFTVDASGIKELGRIVNPPSSFSGPTCPPDAECEGPTPPKVPGPTVTTVPTTPTTLPTDPNVLEACRRAGQCPPEVDKGAPGGKAPATTTTVVCVTTPCPGGGGAPPTTVCAPDQCTGPSTTSTSTSSTVPSSSTSTTSTTTKPSNGCDPLCPMPSINGVGSQIERAIVVGDRVYTVSTTGIVVNQLGDLHSLGWVPFT